MDSLGDAESVAALPTGIDIAYDTFGSQDAEPLLLVMGLGGPMTWWNPDLCRMLADRGFLVIRYDNRDVGRSTRVPGRTRLRTRTIVRAFLGDRRHAPYTLDDMAADGFGLLDHLGIERAHVTGVSMGGMIAQTMAITHPDRVRSLVSMSSTTGSRRVGWQDPRLLPLLLSPVARTREDYVERAVHSWRQIGSQVYPTLDDQVALRAAETWDRGYDPAGGARQTLALLAQPDRAARLGELTMPVCVVHGLDDRLIHPSGGRATARAIRAAELVLVPGMGHDIPRPLYGLVADAIWRTAARTGQSDASATSVSSSSRRNPAIRHTSGTISRQATKPTSSEPL